MLSEAKEGNFKQERDAIVRREQQQQQNRDGPRHANQPPLPLSSRPQPLTHSMKPTTYGQSGHRQNRPPPQNLVKRNAPGFIKPS